MSALPFIVCSEPGRHTRVLVDRARNNRSGIRPRDRLEVLEMKKILLGVFALATAFAMTMAAPAPAKAGNFWSGFAGGAAGAVIGNAISQPRYRYGYQPPPPVVYQAPPAYVAPAPSYSDSCAPRNIGGAWCNVPACWKACGGSFASFSLYDCSYQPYNGPRQRCYK
jgi:hypothetical protein